MYSRESRSEHSHRVDYAKSHPSRIRNLGHQSRRHPNHYYNLDEDDEMPFLDYIMNVKLKLPRGFKPPTNMEPYDGSSDP